MEGKIIEIEGDFALVSHIRTSACGKCRSCFRGSSDEEVISRAKNICKAAIGDTVELELSHGASAQAAITAYGIPLAAMLLGFVSGNFLGGELLAFGIGMAFLGLALSFIFWREKRRKNHKFTPKVVRVIVKK